MVKSDRAPSFYVGHGSPTVTVDKDLVDFKRDLSNFGKQFPDVRSIVVVSAHWQNHIPVQITYAKYPGIVYDYYGFPPEMYELQYSYSGNPKLAEEVAMLLTNNGISTNLNPQRGIDHGAWVPLSIIYPEANIPIIQVSLPVQRKPELLFDIGKILSPLRDKGIMFMGSGNLTHNLSYVMEEARKLGGFHNNLPTVSWAYEVDSWIKEQLDDHNISNLLRSSEMIPNFKMAAPTTEHFDPLYFVLGTLNSDEMLTHFHESFQMGSISMRSFHSEA